MNAAGSTLTFDELVEEVHSAPSFPPHAPVLVEVEGRSFAVTRVEAGATGVVITADASDREAEHAEALEILESIAQRQRTAATRARRFLDRIEGKEAAA